MTEQERRVEERRVTTDPAEPAQPGQRQGEGQAERTENPQPVPAKGNPEPDEAQGTNPRR